MSERLTVSENGIALRLASGATVAGFTTDEGGFAWLFTLGDVKTPLGLSKEAMEAVVAIYAQLVTGVHRGESPPGANRWVLVREPLGELTQCDGPDSHE